MGEFFNVFEQRNRVIPEDAVVKYFETEQQRHSTIIVEGIPIYFSPNPSHPTHAWTSAEFTHGYAFTDRLYGSIDSAKRQLSILVDDYNNCQGQQIDGKQFLRELNQQMGNLAVLEPDNAHYFHQESEYANQDPTCPRMDASFQMNKVHRLTPNPPAVNGLAIVVHPTAFQGQQATMLTELYRDIKKDPRFRQVRKEDKSRVVEQMYQHVWFHGPNIIGVTKPVLKNGQFVFQNVL